MEGDRQDVEEGRQGRREGDRQGEEGARQVGRQPLVEGLGLVFLVVVALLAEEVVLLALVVGLLAVVVLLLLVVGLLVLGGVVGLLLGGRGRAWVGLLGLAR